MMNILGYSRKNRVHTFGQAMLFSGIAIGASLWLMRTCCPDIRTCKHSHPDFHPEPCGCHR